MARFKDVTIRTKDRMNNMAELGKVLQTIGTDHCIVDLPDELEEVPLVYQFCKGKRDGETINPTPDRVIGGVSNIRIAENGDLVGDVRISPMMRLSEHFQGTIDNLLVAKSTPLEDGEKSESPLIHYKLEQLIVYDKITKQREKTAASRNQLVQKTYESPTETYDIAPDAGEKLQTMIQGTNKEMDKVLENNTWKGRKVE